MSLNYFMSYNYCRLNGILFSQYDKFSGIKFIPKNAFTLLDIYNKFNSEVTFRTNKYYKVLSISYHFQSNQISVFQ